MSFPRVQSGRLRPYGRSRFGLIAVCAVLPTGCAAHNWRATPLAEEAVQEKATPDRTVRVETSTGPVLLDVVSVRYPIIEGRVRPGGGEVLFDVTRALHAESVAGGISTRLAANPEEMPKAALVGKLVRFQTEAGRVVLNVTSFEYPIVRGQPGACPKLSGEEAPCPGLVHLDLREASRLEIRETDVGRSILATLAVLGVVWGVAVLVALGLGGWAQ